MSNRHGLIIIILIAALGLNAYALGELSIRYLKSADKDFEAGIRLLEEGKEKEAHKKLEEAIKNYDKVLNLDPYYTPAFTNLTDAYMMMNKYKEAEDYTKRYMAGNRNSVSYFRLATIYHRQDKFDQAIQAYKETLTLPEDGDTAIVLPSIYNNLSIIYETKYLNDKSDTNLELAIDYALKAMKLGVEGSASRLAALYKYKGDVKAALNAVEDAIKNDPSNIELKILKASILEDSGDTETSLKIYEEILSGNIDNDRLEQIGIRFYNARKYKQAADVFVKLTKSNPDETLLINSYLNAANCYQQLEVEARNSGNSSQADIYKAESDKYFGLVSSKAPDNPEAILQQADAALRNGDNEAAIALYDKLVKMGKADFSIFLNMGTAYFNKKDYDNAEKYFQMAATSDIPKKYEFQVFYNLGYTQFILGLKQVSAGNKDAGKNILNKSKQNLQKAKSSTNDSSAIQGIDGYLKQIDSTLNAQ
ncbi:MAG TPA: tetratricopeptide repeat protein [Firmicutes bacterium]|nr:tetratricopeptide repeat protein [Bacillota bacterium]